MSVAVAIGWRGLSAATQDRLVRDAWLLMAWWAVVGLACSWLSLEVFQLRSPALRYPLTALAMHCFGTVAGMRVWLAVFSSEVRAQRGRFGPAREPPAGDARFRRRRGVVVGRDPGVVIAAIGVAIEIAVWFESGATLFWLTLISVAVTASIMAALVWAIGMERLMSDSPGVIFANLAKSSSSTARPSAASCRTGRRASRCRRFCARPSGAECSSWSSARSAA